MGDTESNQMTESGLGEVPKSKSYASSKCLESMRNYFDDMIQHNAFLLTGEWGCGKTHFIKNVLFEAIKSGEIGGCDENKFKPVYVSLDGVSDEESVSRMIVYRMLSDKVETTVVPGAEILTQAVLNSAGEGSASKDLVKVAKKTFEGAAMKKIMGKPHVIVLDDLERCKMSIEETCGYVNRLIEGGNGNTKVVLVANEGKLSSWGTIKEKTVGMMIKFKPDFREAVSSIVDDADDELKKFMNKDGNYKAFMVAFDECKCLNLRTVQAALSVVCKVIPILLAQKVKPECTQAIIESIAKSEIEYSKKGFEPWSDGAQEYTSKMVNSVALRSAMGLPPEKSDDVKPEQERHQFKFVEDYIANGGFDDEKVSEVITKFEFNVFPDEEKQPYKFALNRLGAFFEQEDLTIRKDIAKVLEGVRNGGLSNLTDLEESLRRLICVKYIGFKDAQNVIDVIIETVESVSVENVHDVNIAFNDYGFHIDELPEEARKEYRETCENIVAYCAEEARSSAIVHLNEAWSSDDWSDSAFSAYREIVDNPYSRDDAAKGFLSRFDIKTLKQNIANASVLEISNFRRKLASLYNRNEEFFQLSEERLALKELEGFLEGESYSSVIKDFNRVLFIRQIDGWLSSTKEPEQQ